MTVEHVFQLVHEGVDVAELPVDRGKAHIGNFVDFFQFVHGKLADVHGGDLPLVAVQQRLLDAVHRGFQRLVAYLPLFTGAQHAAQQLLAVKGLAGAVPLDHHQGHGLHDLVGREALGAAQALPAAANFLSVLGGAGIDYLGIQFAAVRTFHGSFLLGW